MIKIWVKTAAVGWRKVARCKSYPEVVSIRIWWLTDLLTWVGEGEKSRRMPGFWLMLNWWGMGGGREGLGTSLWRLECRKARSEGTITLPSFNMFLREYCFKCGTEHFLELSCSGPLGLTGGLLPTDLNPRLPMWTLSLLQRSFQCWA